MILLGDYWGSKYDLLRTYRNYVRLKVMYGIKLYNPAYSSEFLQDPNMYMPISEFKTSSGDVIYDIGAQYGDFSLWWAYHGSQVLAVELLLENFFIMERNLSLNPLLSPKIRTLRAAVGNGQPLTYAVSGEMANNFMMGNKKTVKRVKIDDIDMKPPTVIKIDVEGFEMQVLEGAVETIKEFIPRLIVETHSSELERRVVKFCYGYGYRVAYIKKSRTLKGIMDRVSNMFFIHDDL